MNHVAVIGAGITGLTAAFLCIGLSRAGAAAIPVASAEREADGVLLQMRPGVTKLQVCADRIIRVVYSPTDRLPARQSLVVNAKWPATRFKLETGKQWVGLSTKSLSVHVDRASGAISFLDADGHVIVQEPAEDGRRMTPVQVNGEHTFQPKQTFVSPADEALFGLGQFQDGLWNWRGVPRQLRQVNTQIVLPMLLSSRGYGLLWDNASLTDFNPPEREVSLDPLTHRGTFSADREGDYVFLAKATDLRDHFALAINNQTVARLTNYWVPSFLSAKIHLAADQACLVKLDGGGSNAVVCAGPVSGTSTFRSQVGDVIDYYFFYGPEPDEVIAGYRQATGTAPMLPRWAFGFWQCRERYSSQAQILEAAAEFRERRIPVDVIVQDWRYWGKYGWGAFRFDEASYPDPAGMIQRLHELNFRFMISVWSKASGAVRDELKGADALLPRGKEGQEWFDAFKPEARTIRWKHMKQSFFDLGVDAWWMDATEPETELLENFQTVLGSVNRLVNAYPLFVSQSVYEGQRAASADKRVCILTRSAFPGAQRYGTICWSGDVAATWDSFRRQIPAGLNFSMAGMPYWTTDIGGFFRPANQYRSADYQELLLRWFEFGAFCPIFRIHGNATETEMWKWPADVEKTMRFYDELRYRLLPYLYSVAWRVTSEGNTMMRALAMDFPNDPKAVVVSDQFMLGPALMISPVTRPGAVRRDVYLPAGSAWFDFWSGAGYRGGQMVSVEAPLERIPVFVRAGSIVPMGPALQYTGEQAANPIELRVYLGADGAFTLYEDEGDNYSYEKGAFATIPISWDERRQTLTIGKRKGEFPGMLKEREFRIVWTRPDESGGVSTSAPAAGARYTGAVLKIRLHE